MTELGLSKQQVLKEIYVRELPLVCKYISQRRKRRELENLVQCKCLLEIAVATAGMAPSKEGIDALFEEFRRRAFELAQPIEIEEEMKKPEDPYEQLKRLQGIIGQTQNYKRKNLRKI